MATDARSEVVSEAAAVVLPLDRDPFRFPFGLLLVAPGLFQTINGFNWFASEADALDFLREGVWPAIELPADRKQVCQALAANSLREIIHLDEAALTVFAEAQDELLLVWAGEFEGVRSGSDDFALELLTSTAEGLETPELAETPEGRIQLLSAFRWHYTGGVEGLRALFSGLPADEQSQFLDELDGAFQDTGLPNRPAA